MVIELYFGMLLQVLIIELDMLHVQLENYTLLLQVVIELYFGMLLQVLIIELDMLHVQL